MKKEIKRIEPFVWLKEKKFFSPGRKGFLILTTDSIAIVTSSSSENLKEEKVDGAWKDLGKDIARGMGVDTEHEISHLIGKYTYEDFEQDMKNDLNFEIKFDSIIRLEVGDYHFLANKLLVVYQDGKKERKYDFIKIKRIEERSPLDITVIGTMYDWENVKNMFLSLKDKK
ncbi:MAG: hypothetical protein OEW49_01960 [Nitrosopumilus sp.]|nr:hypothetical protein [Nitrosopumilus sp.]